MRKKIMGIETENNKGLVDSALVTAGFAGDEFAVIEIGYTSFSEAIISIRKMMHISMMPYLRCLDALADFGEMYFKIAEAFGDVDLDEDGDTTAKFLPNDIAWINKTRKAQQLVVSSRRLEDTIEVSSRWFAYLRETEINVQVDSSDNDGEDPQKLLKNIKIFLEESIEYAKRCKYAQALQEVGAINKLERAMVFVGVHEGGSDVG